MLSCRNKKPPRKSGDQSSGASPMLTGAILFDQAQD
jgi:hypothetical protein